jgi:hypothetical protein
MICLSSRSTEKRPRDYGWRTKLASTRPPASRARRRSPPPTKLELKAKPMSAGTAPTPPSCPCAITVTVTPRRISPRTERVRIGVPAGEQVVQISGA